MAVKPKTTRERIVLFSRKAGGWCFLISMLGGLASLVFKPAAILFPLCFPLAFVFFGLMFLPESPKPAYWRQHILFLFFMGAGTSIALMVAGMVTHTPMKSAYMQNSGYLFMFSVLCGFIGMAVNGGGEGRATRKELLDALEKAAKKLGMTVTDKSTRNVLTISAAGESGGERISFLLRRSNSRSAGRPGPHAPPPSCAIAYTGQLPPPPVKILCTRGIVDITADDSLLKEKIASFIADKGLEEFDIDLVTTPTDVVLRVDVAIEEEELWLDCVNLCRIVSGN